MIKLEDLPELDKDMVKWVCEVALTIDGLKSDAGIKRDAVENTRTVLQAIKLFRDKINEACELKLEEGK
jgi:hypothetical protein